MNIMNKVSGGVNSFLEVIKKESVHAGQFCLFIVSLGHYGHVRVKGQRPYEASVSSTSLDARSVSQDEVDKLFNYISRDEKEGFEQSVEYKEYQKNSQKSNDSNAFYSINLYYQQYRAKSFINENHPDQNPEFFLSPEYRNYLLGNPFNPFVAEIKEVYDAYNMRVKS